METHREGVGDLVLDQVRAALDQALAAERETLAGLEGDDARFAELELDMNTSYTVHLRSLPSEQIRYHRLNSDSAALISGKDPDCSQIVQLLASFLPKTAGKAD